METKRQAQFSRLIQRNLSEIFQKKAYDWLGRIFITVTSVRMSSDLHVADVYLSFLLTEDSTSILRSIMKKNGVIRNELARRIKNQARIIPELRWHVDNMRETNSRLDEFFNSLKD